MNYWLLKTEPDTYSFDNLIAEKTGRWDGVRNFQARGHLKAIKKGDSVFIYHTGKEKSIVGIAEVIREHYPDPTDSEWVVIDLKGKKKLKNPVTLAQIKSDKRLSNMVLVKAARLSVQPVQQTEFDLIVKKSEE